MSCHPYTRCMDDDLTALISDPTERLNVEYKDWLDLTNRDQQAVLAKAFMAMANQGGGTVILGFRQENQGPLLPSDAQAPSSVRTQYSPDRLHQPIARYADPVFEVKCQYIRHPSSNFEHPVIVVPGGLSVPVLAKRGSPDGKTLLRGHCYIRRPGPSSEQPQTPAEWRTFFDRILANRREELRALFSNTWLEPTPSESPPANQSVPQGPEPRAAPSVRDRMSDAPPPPSPARIRAAYDALSREDQKVFDGVISQQRVETLRAEIESHLRAFPMRRLFTAVGTYRRESRYDLQLRYGVAFVSYKGPFVEGSNWVETRERELAFPFEEFLLRQLADILLERLDHSSTPLASAQALERFVVDAIDQVTRDGGQPDLLILLGRLSESMTRDLWRNPPWWQSKRVVRGVDVTNVELVNGALHDLPVLWYRDNRVKQPSAHVVDLADFEYLQTNPSDTSDDDVVATVSEIDEAEAISRLNADPALAQRLFESSHQGEQGSFSREEAIVHLQMRVKESFLAAGMIRERHRPRTHCAWLQPDPEESTETPA